MKAPEIAKIPDANETSFVERAKQAKKSTKASKGAKKISYSVYPDDEKYINSIALKLGQKRGKSMSASEALRLIVDEHRRSA